MWASEQSMYKMSISYRSNTIRILLKIIYQPTVGGHVKYGSYQEGIISENVFVV